MVDSPGDLVTDLEKPSGGYQRSCYSGNVLDLGGRPPGSFLERQLVVERAPIRIKYGAYPRADLRRKGPRLMAEWNQLATSSY